VKNDASLWGAAVVARDTSCPSRAGDPPEATRLREFVNAIDRRGVFTPICRPDLAGAMKAAFTTFSETCAANAATSIR
jgi:hypothetical protein